MSKLITTIAALLISTTIAGCASMVLGYSSEAITATIVDADSKQPLKDVIVVAQWELRKGGFPAGSQFAGLLKIMETITNGNGIFTFPEWGQYLIIQVG